ncbi:MAG: hypothetical protein KDD67_07010 [Ignavibacteriae bacterium]|nr:hypothetical protein [Ignavibacteriota bacterium]MCB9215226.1 hypothetical protein [Ignavibacteria bacterium]
MRIVFAAIMLLCLATVLLQAQEMSSAWFGGIGVGIGAHDNEAFSNRLSSWSPVGENGREMVYRTGRFSSTGFTANAGGGLLLGGGFVLGASGERLFFPSVVGVTTEEEVGEYSLSGGGGGLEFGWAFYNNSGTLVWPYVSVGYYGYALDFTNNLSDSIPLFEGTPIAPGGQATYTGAAPRIGLGVGLTRFLGGSKGASSITVPVVTARLGWGIFPSHPEWEQDGVTVNNGGHTPCYSALALSVTIGGGGASF